MTTYYMTDENGKITQSGAAIPQCYPKGSYKETEEEIEYGYDGQLYFKSQLPVMPPDLVRERQIQEWTSKVYTRLADFLRERGYDGPDSMDKYDVDSPAGATDVEKANMAQFRREAVYAKGMISLTWASFYAIINMGAIQDTWETIEPRLPKLNWEDAR